MFVDTGLLRLGAQESHHAGGQARDGASRLAREPQLPTLFGDFAAAETFHDAVIAVQADHVRTLDAHKKVLTALGDQAANAATEFADMDEYNAAIVRVVRCGSNT
ncbi:hypothetical protein MSIMFB_03262 [Mycobacterium simulans]|uniref:DUF2563 family protein n=1 Tax=Mycobacterium simulans TaxID=627089 RepID=A0A7Z7IM76_9MYCO|nr:DUF2563 family protein [Mycobacterium simulans]SOJ55783.1 hypothetical protein MSIMFB_03262 [Mycobacterium simulans]